MKSFSLFFILNLSLNVLSGDVHSTSFLIKFLTSFTEYPVRLVDNFGSYESSNTVIEKSKWFKHGSNSFVDELDQSSKYFSTEINSNGGVNLLLLNYDTKTNILLDHYEPYHYKDDEMQQTEKEIYTLVFLKSFDLKVNETESDIKASCELTLSIPAGISDEHTEIINENIEETITLEIGYDDEKQSRSKSNKQIKKRNSNSKRSADSKLSAFEKTYSTGSINLNKFTFQSDQKSVNITCYLVLRDFDNSHAFDTSLSKIINLSKNEMIKPLVGQNSNAAHKFNFTLFNLISFVVVFSLLSIFV